MAGRALVYRGPAADPDCTAAVVRLLTRSPHGLDVTTVGPDGDQPLGPDALDGALLYAQPGGGTLRRAWKRLRGDAGDVRAYVAGGGRYLGFCLGGYLAGATPGFALLPGDTDRYVGTPGAAVGGTGDTVVPVRWRGHDRWMFFQDGPRFVLDPGARDVDVLATYPGGEPAAVVCAYGRGTVGVVGPHPEATADWYADSDLPNPDGVRDDLGLDLVAAVLAPR